MKKLIIGLTALLALAACTPNYSEGERVGVVTKLSKKGIWWKSWEGQLNQGGIRFDTDANGKEVAVPNVMKFNVQDPATLKVLLDALESGKRVKVSYSEWLAEPVTIESSYVVTAAKTLD